MKETIERLTELLARVESALPLIRLPEKRNQLKELELLMQEPEFWQDHIKASAIAKTAAQLNKTIQVWQDLEQQIKDLLTLAQDDQRNHDVNLRSEIDQQLEVLRKQYEQLELQLLMQGKHDSNDAIVSVHAGAGGDDAQDWAEMLSRMYIRWAEQHGYAVNIIDATRGAVAGVKSIMIKISGALAYGQLQGEFGVHRLVRLSPFNADHARHTSFALVEVLPELSEIEHVVISDTDLRIDTFRSSGAGGQHVNVTDSAVRVTHLPTGITVSCQNERSQASNKATALSILQSKLQQLAAAQRVQEVNELKGEHKEVAWGNQIRSYVLHPYKMVKDLRTEYEESDPDGVLGGALDGFIEAYLRGRIQ